MDFKILRALGVSEKAATLYLAGLALGPATAQELARKSGLKRPTSYMYLDELIEQGLLERLTLGKKRYYRATDPSGIEARITENLHVVQKSLPALKMLGRRFGEKPQIHPLDTWEKMQDFCSRTLSGKEICIYSGLVNLEGAAGGIRAFFAQIIRERAVKTREIVANTKESRKCARHFSKTHGSSYIARVGTTSTLKDMVVISEKSIVLFRFLDRDFTATGIEDMHAAESQEALFEMAWHSAHALKQN